MTAKKMLLVLLMLGLTLSLFANGQQSEDGKRHDGLQDLIESKEKVTLTGELILANRNFPELKVGTEVYTLMVPHFYLANIEIEEGAEVSVEGVIFTVKMDVNTRRFKAGEKVLFVEKATINGEEYNLQEGVQECSGCRGNMGKRGMGHTQKGRGGHMFGNTGPDEEIFE